MTKQASLNDKNRSCLNVEIYHRRFEAVNFSIFSLFDEPEGSGIKQGGSVEQSNKESPLEERKDDCDSIDQV